MWTRIPYSAKISLPVRQYVGEAARKPILPPRKIRTEKYGKNGTERYGIPNFRRFRKSLATSTLQYLLTWVLILYYAYSQLTIQSFGVYNTDMEAH